MAFVQLPHRQFPPVCLRLPEPKAWRFVERAVRRFQEQRATAERKRTAKSDHPPGFLALMTFGAACLSHDMPSVNQTLLGSCD